MRDDLTYFARKILTCYLKDKTKNVSNLDTNPAV